jgi:hypothetical protein
MGVYADNGNMLPGTLIQDFGFVSSSLTSLVFRPLNSSPNIQLKAKTVYWTAVVGDNALRLPVPFAVNGMYNPILQVEISSSGTTFSHKNIFSYGFVSGGAATNLPLTMSSTASAYTVNSFFTASGYIGPLIKIKYA